jgi:hypothetical protein
MDATMEDKNLRRLNKAMAVVIDGLSVHEAVLLLPLSARLECQQKMRAEAKKLRDR